MNSLSTAAPTEPISEFRCNACGLEFPDSAEQRDHYKSDFHVYNTKRKVAGLAPICPEVWTARVEQLKQLAEGVGDTKGTAHLKHRDEGEGVQGHHKERREESNGPQVEIVRDDKTCLFDNTQHATVEDNLAYMSLKYSFFIPDIDYLKDLPGLLSMLTEKIYERHQCLYCNKIYSGVGAVKSHMIDMKHTRIGTDTDELLADLDPFYDFSSSYLELQAAASQEEGEAYDSDDDDSDDWTEIGSVSGDEEDLDEAVIQTGLQRAQILDDGSLRLPNGKVATHRMYAYIYKQRLTNNRVGDKRHEPRRALPQQKNAMLAIAGGDQSGAIMSMKSYREQKREAKSLLKSMRFMDFEAQKSQVRSNMLQKSRKGRTNRQNVTLWSYAK
ncbi:conserved hypothetical protein [Perkinsus marinus ATCC 50983]|uniref:C2H2-type domain-containing protein n=1 Tax=Perkinsus marinus (strain ATCC 50983 / TXsc) TaxID=423536 RepID=C5LQU6_PERM5|nr:conserved hypothetical protein [Perkinsus marinus ATCC 50983]EER00831.1 conserved hypothetical protein [Perkinsus marinus ATCC 50983]|eukprot:XP_002768113.1 conserved hypothetical protein [Perkinsus marinus ATCC 50983]